MHPSDEQLITAYLERDDQQAFRQLVERYQEQIFGYLMGMVHNRAVADDLFQETFLRVISAMQDRRGSYARKGQWLSWVMRIARNATIDHFRKQKKWKDVDAAFDEGRSFWDTIADETPFPDERLHREEQRAWIDTYIQQLAPEQREVLHLRQETDLTFREIGELTGVSINTALGRMRYALKNLHRMMMASKKKSLAELTDE